jgi:hypothetical protein
MECELERLERQMKQVPLGAAIARIVRIIVKVVQMDVCQGGMTSIAAYALLPEFTRPDDSIESVAREVFGTLCSPGMRAGEWNRALAVPTASAIASSSSSRPLQFTPFEPTTPCVSRSPLVAALAVKMRAAVTGTDWETECSDAKKAQAKQSLVRQLTDLVTPGQRECTEHMVLAMSRMMGERSVRMMDENEALSYIRWEIARAVCAGSTGPIPVDEFAFHVAKTIVDGVCDISAALRS